LLDDLRSTKIDDLDRQLLGRLMRDGRATWSDLANDVGITAPAIAQRVRRMEQSGVVRGFAAIVDPAGIAPVAAFVTLRPGPGDDHTFVAERVVKLAAVQECHYLAGDDGYLLKVRCRSVEELDRLVRHTLRELAPAAVISTQVILATAKESPVVPGLDS